MFFRAWRNAPFLRLLGPLAVLWVLMSGNAVAVADRYSGWAVPKRIPGSYNSLGAPYLVADQYGVVHAFIFEITPRVSAVFYRHWTLETGWSSPADIILPKITTGSTSVQGAFVDQNDKLHLIHFNGTELTGDIYYSAAQATEAGSIQAWSEPVLVGPSAGPVAAAALSGDGHGQLVVVYSGQVSGLGLYEVHSTDNGQTWSTPASIFTVDKEDRWPVAVWLEPDDYGRFHAVWHVANGLGQGEEIYYARLEADLAHWNYETILARKDTELENMGWGSIISSGDELIAIYQDSFPATRWMRRSSDGGQTWANPVRPFPYVGGYGYASLVKDSAGTIHMLLGNRFPQPETHGMWYSQLVNNQWTPLQSIISGPKNPTFDPTRPQAVISRGNVILAAWVNDVNQEFRTGAWYSYAVLDAPELPTKPLPTQIKPVSIPTTVHASPTVTAAPLPTATLAFDIQNQPDAPQASNPGLFIFWGVAPVVLLVTVIVIGHVRRRHTT